MAETDKAIGELPQATQLGDNDLFVLEQNGIAKKMLMSLWKDYISRNVVSASASQLPAGSQPTATFNPTNGALALGIPKGDKGDRGEPGASSAGYVSGIVKGDGAGGVSAAVAGTDFAAMTNLHGRNLLDNPWFTVNQRGVTSGTVTSGIYTVDRWIAGNIFFNTANNALTLQAAGAWSMFYQKLDNLERYKGLTVTLSCDAAIASGSNAALAIDDGTWNAVPLQNGITKIVYTVPQSATRLQAMIFANYSDDASDTTTIVVKSVKLELGSVSTLANDTAPNYQQELAKCQRYYYRMQANRAWTRFGNGMVDAQGRADMLINLPITMRDVPSVIVSGVFILWVGTTNFTINEESISIVTDNLSTNTITLRYIGSETLQNGVPCTIQSYGSLNTYIAASADL